MCMVLLFPPYCNSKSKCLLWLCVHKLVTLPFLDCLVFHDPTYSQEKPLSIWLAINMRITFTAVITILKGKSFKLMIFPKNRSCFHLRGENHYYRYLDKYDQIIDFIASREGWTDTDYKEKGSEQALTKQCKSFLHLKQFMPNITSFISVKRGFTIYL